MLGLPSWIWVRSWEFLNFPAGTGVWFVATGNDTAFYSCIRHWITVLFSSGFSFICSFYFASISVTHSFSFLWLITQQYGYLWNSATRWDQNIGTCKSLAITLSSRFCFQVARSVSHSPTHTVSLQFTTRKTWCFQEIFLASLQEQTQSLGPNKSL